MAQITVILIRCGETELEAYADITETPLEEDEENEEPPSPGNFLLSPGRSSPRKPKKKLATTGPRKLRHSEKIDPFLTREGYGQAQLCLTQIVQLLAASTDQERRLAAVSAPLASCLGTALGLTVAQVPRYTNLRWQWTLPSSIQAPCAIPIVICDDLCTAEPEVEACGGSTVVVDAGLLHGAGRVFNDARLKCPLAKLWKQFKQHTKDDVRAWKEEVLKVEEGEEEPYVRRVLDAQFLRVGEPTKAKQQRIEEEELEQGEGPWELQEMSVKSNLLIDLIEPVRYKTPPRKGMLAAKRQGKIERPNSTVAVRHVVWSARQTGCDTCIVFCGEAALQELAVAAGAIEEPSQLEVPACSMVSCIATVPDTDDAQDVEFALHGFYTLDDLDGDLIPPYTGPVDMRKQPPSKLDPTQVPANQWSKFKPPAPENIPDDYPDLPPFSQALTAPVPKRPKAKKSKEKEEKTEKAEVS